MKNLYFLLLLCSGFLMAAPPSIVPPSPLVQCDTNNDAAEVFDLTSKESEILQLLNAPEYTVAYYADNAHTMPIPAPESFSVVDVPNVIVYIQVTEIANPSNFASTLLELVMAPLPVVASAPDIVVQENPFDGFATFDITSNTLPLTGGVPGVTVMYYHFQMEAEVGTNEIPFASSYVNMTNPQTIWVRLQNNTTGCFTITNFDLVVTPSDVVYIPDPNFKAWLLSADVSNNIALGAALENVKIDVNSDGEIQYSEALLAYYLDVHQANIGSLQGIESFTNLKRLDCFSNSLTTLNVSALSNLEILFCQYNQLAALNITGLTNLVMLSCYNNQLTSLDVTLNSNLQNLQCGENQLTSLNVSGLPALNTLYCELNHLATLDLTGLPSLKYLSCRSNLLTSLDFSELINLLELNCNSNELTAIDVSQSPQLSTLACAGNQISTLNVSMLPDLATLHCNDNLLTTLDCSANSHLTYLRCYANQLQTLFVKNGSNETFDPANVVENPDLEYICADDFQLELLQELAGPNISVNSYCFFTPSGDYNTITGTFHFDNDNNGCTETDVTPQYIKMTIDDGATQGATFTNSEGVYNFYTGAGNFSLWPDFESPEYFGLFLPYNVNFPAEDGSLDTKNLCIIADGTHHDLEVVLAPIVPARPGFDAVYKIVYRNKGNQTNNGVVQLNFDSTKMQLLSAVPAQDNQNEGQLSFFYNDLYPFENREILVTMHINAPTDGIPVNVNDILDFSADITLNGVDETPQDNAFAFHQTVVGSYDPNDLRCVEGEVLASTEIGNYLHYIANFENTGTDAAVNIVVRMDIDPTQFDVNSLRILNSSHSAQIIVTGNKAEYIFENINLAIGGHGNILLKIKTMDNLVTGDMVSNKADIYFDYNLPVVTNDAETLFQMLSVPKNDWDQSISVYPNPANNVVNIKADSEIRSIQIYDVQGRILQVSQINENNLVLDISDKQTGIYFLKITSEKGMKMQKLVKN
jgi:hypothetical protein